MLKWNWFADSEIHGHTLLLQLVRNQMSDFQFLWKVTFTTARAKMLQTFWTDEGDQESIGNLVYYAVRV
jgi:hypothetical protein